MNFSLSVSNFTAEAVASREARSTNLCPRQKQHDEWNVSGGGFGVDVCSSVTYRRARNGSPQEIGSCQRGCCSYYARVQGGC